MVRVGKYIEVGGIVEDARVDVELRYGISGTQRYIIRGFDLSCLLFLHG